jgi:hypothetical protein
LQPIEIRPVNLGIARDVNRLGRMDAMTHDAGVYTGPHVLPVNTPVTALIGRPAAPRLPQQQRPLQRATEPGGVDWSARRSGSYPDSKLFVTTLAAAVARHAPPLTGRPR